VLSLRTLRDKILRRALNFTIVPNLFEMNAVYTAVWGERERETVYQIIALLLVCEDFDP
jgi:hypothetical protein